MEKYKIIDSIKFVAISLLIAESNPEEIDSIIKVVNNLLGQF